MADADAVKAAAAAAHGQWGRTDAWVNNTMATVFAPVTDTTAAGFRRVTGATYVGYVHRTQAALRPRCPPDQGVIVRVGSALAYRSTPLHSAYLAAKATTAPSATSPPHRGHPRTQPRMRLPGPPAGDEHATVAATAQQGALLAAARRSPRCSPRTPSPR